MRGAAAGSPCHRHHNTDIAGLPWAGRAPASCFPEGLWRGWSVGLQLGTVRARAAGAMPPPLPGADGRDLRQSQSRGRRERSPAGEAGAGAERAGPKGRGVGATARLLPSACAGLLGSVTVPWAGTRGLREAEGGHRLPGHPKSRSRALLRHKPGGSPRLSPLLPPPALPAEPPQRCPCSLLLLFTNPGSRHPPALSDQRGFQVLYT